MVTNTMKGQISWSEFSGKMKQNLYQAHNTHTKECHESMISLEA